MFYINFYNIIINNTVCLSEKQKIEDSEFFSCFCREYYLDEILDVRKLWYGNQYREDVVNAKNIIEEEGSQL